MLAAQEQSVHNLNEPESRRSQAARFIEALTGDADAVVTFQTFADTGESEAAPAIIHASLADAWERLEDLQDCGHGVFVCVNATDGRGRGTQNVTGLRALFADDDKGTVHVPMLAGARPSMCILSGNGSHFYWLLKAGEQLADFTPAQKGIAAKLATDAKVCDVARVMRLPGSYNLKDRSNPRLVELVYIRPERRYTISEVLTGLGASPSAPPGTSGPIPARGPRVLGSEAKRRAEAYIATIHAVEGQGGDTATYQAAAALLRDFGLDRNTAWDCLKAWNQTNAHPAWSEKELGKKFQHAERYGKAPLGGKLAEQLGAAVDANAEAALRDLGDNPQLEPSNWCFDAAMSKPWRYYHGGVWRDGVTEKALDRLLENEGKLAARAIAAWKKRVAVVDEAAPVYASTDRIAVVNGVKIANTFRRPALVPERFIADGKNAPPWGPIATVLMNLVNGDEEGYRWLIGWLGKVVQGVHSGNPQRTGVAPVFFGAKGAGKGVLEEVCKALLGPWNVVSIGQRELTSDFNSYLENALLVFANEVYSSEARGTAMLSRLKDHITCHHRLINRKGCPEVTRDARENWILSSNSHRPIEVEKGDRRLTLFRTGPALPVELGARVADDSRGNGPLVRSFLAYLLALPASALAHDYRPLITAAKEEVRAASGNSATKFASEVAALGFWSCTGPWAGGVRVGTSDLYLPGREHSGGPVILRRKLNDVYRAWAAQINAPAQQETTVIAALREECPGLYEGHALVDGRRERVIAGLPGMLPATALVENPQQQLI